MYGEWFLSAVMSLRWAVAQILPPQLMMSEAIHIRTNSAMDISYRCCCCCCCGYSSQQQVQTHRRYKTLILQFYIFFQVAFWFFSWLIRKQALYHNTTETVYAFAYAHHQNYCFEKNNFCKFFVFCEFVVDYFLKKYNLHLQSNQHMIWSQESMLESISIVVAAGVRTSQQLLDKIE